MTLSKKSLHFSIVGPRSRSQLPMSGTFITFSDCLVYIYINYYNYVFIYSYIFQGEVTINYNKLHADPKQGKSLDIGELFFSVYFNIFVFENKLKGSILGYVS